MHEWGPYEFTLWSDKEFPGSSWKFPGEDLDFETSVYQVVDAFNRRHLGGVLMIAGAAVLVPGPFDVAAAGIGAAVGGPPGAVAGVVIYNLAGVSMFVLGAYLSGESVDLDLPSMPQFRWDRAHRNIGANPMVWGVPGFLES